MANGNRVSPAVDQADGRPVGHVFLVVEERLAPGRNPLRLVGRTPPDHAAPVLDEGELAAAQLAQDLFGPDQSSSVLEELPRRLFVFGHLEQLV